MKTVLKGFGLIVGAYLFWAFSVAGYSFYKEDYPQHLSWKAKQEAARLASAQ